MADLSTFERTEKKYLISEDQYHKLMEIIGDRIRPDAHGSAVITSIYYDNDDYELIRESIERPVYKEKMRVRVYGDIEKTGKAFAEIKKKYDHVVYKRRVPLLPDDLRESLKSGKSLAESLNNHKDAEPQKAEEIRYMIERYGLKPKIVIRCERDPYVAIENDDVRLTFDKCIVGKDEDMDIDDTSNYRPITDEEMRILEIKAPLAMPLWLSEAINSLGIYPGRFSKVGTYYVKYLSKETGRKFNVK